LFDIFIDDLVAGLHDTCSEHGICMGQTDVAAVVICGCECTILHPNGKVDGLHPHLAQQMADAREFHQKQGDGISPKGESCSVPAKDRRNAWTLGGIAIDQVSKYKYLGVVYQEDGSWQARAKALAKMQAAYGYWRPLLSCSSLPTKVRLLMVQTFIYSAVMYGAEVWDTTKAVKDKMSAVVKLSAAF
jgi:hypothetical protein